MSEQSYKNQTLAAYAKLDKLWPGKTLIADLPNAAMVRTLDDEVNAVWLKHRESGWDMEEFRTALASWGREILAVLKKLEVKTNASPF
jgi:hypothetical protein